MHENIEKFIKKLEESLDNGTFVKLTLSNYKGEEAYLQKIVVRLVQTKKGLRLFFLYHYSTRNIAKNYDFQEGARLIRESLGKVFFNAHLFTTQNDFHLDIRKEKARLSIGKATFKVQLSLAHNREKKILLDPQAPYLRALGITNEKGEIRNKQQDKWKQINKFVEILGSFFDKSALRNCQRLKVVDMGAGKGYLTFVIYDYFKNIRRLDVEVTGIDIKKELIEFCNSIAQANEFEKLRFVHGLIGDFDLQDVDILIALHACDTATDDAIFQAVKAKAEMIVVAPCCHKEIRKQMKPLRGWRQMLKHGILLERFAETITDGLRALLLEREGYATRVFEFVSVEHTPKNNMIVAIKKDSRTKTEVLNYEIEEIKNFYGIQEQRLEKLLATLQK